MYYIYSLILIPSKNIIKLVPYAFFHNAFQKLNEYLGKLQFIHTFHLPLGTYMVFVFSPLFPPPNKILRIETTSNYTVRNTCLWVWTSFNNLLLLAWCCRFMKSSVCVVVFLLPEDC